MSSQDCRNIEDEAIDYEKSYGSVALLKAIGSAVNKLLVKKGLVSIEEIQEAFCSELINQRPKDGVGETSVNYLQISKCECGEELMCFCGRCHRCQKQRIEGTDLVSKAKKRWTFIAELRNKGLVSDAMLSREEETIDRMGHAGFLTTPETCQMQDFYAEQRKAMGITDVPVDPFVSAMLNSDEFVALKKKFDELSSRFDGLPYFPTPDGGDPQQRK